AAIGSGGCSPASMRRAPWCKRSPETAARPSVTGPALRPASVSRSAFSADPTGPSTSPTAPEPSAPSTPDPRTRRLLDRRGGPVYYWTYGKERLAGGGGGGVGVQRPRKRPRRGAGSDRAAREAARIRPAGPPRAAARPPRGAG